MAAGRRRHRPVRRHPWGDHLRSRPGCRAVESARDDLAPRLFQDARAPPTVGLAHPDRSGSRQTQALLHGGKRAHRALPIHPLAVRSIDVEYCGRNVRYLLLDEVQDVLDMGLQVHLAREQVGTLPHARQRGGEHASVSSRWVRRSPLRVQLPPEPSAHRQPLANLRRRRSRGSFRTAG
jgi:hypothetical protein